MSEQTQPTVMDPAELAAILEQQRQPAASVEPVAPTRPTDVMMGDPGQPWDFMLSDGRTLTLQKPAKPIALFVAKLLGADSYNSGLELYFKSMLWVVKYEGVPLPALQTRAGVESFHELLGDDALEELVREVMMPSSKSDEVDFAALKKLSKTSGGETQPTS